MVIHEAEIRGMNTQQSLCVQLIHLVKLLGPIRLKI